MSPTGAVPIQKPGDGVQLSSSLVSEDDKNIHTTKESEDAVVSGMNYSVDDNLLEITNRNGTARNDQVCLVKVAIRKSDDAMKVADESKKTEVSDRNCADLEGFRSKPIGHADHDADKACEVVIPSKPVYSDCSTTAECTDASNRRAHNGVISMIETEADAKSGAAAVECGNVLTECCTSVNANDQHCSGEISNTVEWLINLAANCQDSSDSVEKDDGSHGSSFSKCHRVTMSAVVEKINGPAHVVTSAAMPSSSSTLGEAVCLRTEEETDRTLQKSAERTADSLTCKAEKGIHEVLPSSSKPSCLSPSTSFRKRSPCRLGAKRHHPIDDEGGPSRTYSRHTEACKEGVSQLKNDSDIMHKSSNGIVGESSGRNSVNDSALSDEDDDEEEEEEDFLNAYAVYGRPPRSMRASMLVERMWQQGFTPRQILSELLPRAVISADIEDADIIQIINGIIDNDRPARFTLHHYCKFGDAVQLFKERKHILILSGAGISVSCGIPDFRSRDGIYARLRVEYPDLPEPSSMFDINYFNQNPRPFFEFAKVCWNPCFNLTLLLSFVVCYSC
ncbi:hypothetical protein AB6A40_005598 [Gnathostoma spinigerum]|uniref:Deacetylase sirtuin-type domain-containing protein n=1 Tax=Gnathostoma spinigerum TaxID=75299 RepID=A0ABD6ENJ1_9BILA